MAANGQIYQLEREILTSLKGFLPAAIRHRTHERVIISLTIQLEFTILFFFLSFLPIESKELEGLLSISFSSFPF
jgi:hypothetical protein